MSESRCGLRCNACLRREGVGCKGCTNMPAPYWGGICQIKTCVECRHIDHCGQCEKFPCETAMGAGREETYDPTVRLRQCRKWAREEAAQREMQEEQPENQEPAKE